MITLDHAILDVVEKHPAIQAVLERYDQQASECICCNSLFETIGEVAEKYGIDLQSFLEDINTAVDASS